MWAANPILARGIDGDRSARQPHETAIEVPIRRGKQPSKQLDLLGQAQITGVQAHLRGSTPIARSIDVEAVCPTSRLGSMTTIEVPRELDLLGQAQITGTQPSKCSSWPAVWAVTFISRAVHATRFARTGPNRVARQELGRA